MGSCKLLGIKGSSHHLSCLLGDMELGRWYRHRLNILMFISLVDEFSTIVHQCHPISQEKLQTCSSSYYRKTQKCDLELRVLMRFKPILSSRYMLFEIQCSFCTLTTMFSSKTREQTVLFHCCNIGQDLLLTTDNLFYS